MPPTNSYVNIPISSISEYEFVRNKVTADVSSLNEVILVRVDF